MAEYSNLSTSALAQRDIKKLFFEYAIPAIIATCASSLYNIIDRIFIGNGVGPLAIAGLALTFPIMNLAVALSTLVGAGACAIVSIRMGEQRNKYATLTLGNAMVVSIFISIVFSIFSLIFLNPILRLFGASHDTLPYARDFLQIILAGNVITNLLFGLNNIMRASGYPTKAMISILLTVGVNLILAPIFIFVFKWGIRGAAFATILSQCCGLSWVLCHFCDGKSYIHFTPYCFKLSSRIIRDIFAIGLSPFLIHCCSCIIVIIVNLQLKRYGDIDYAGLSLNGQAVAGGDLAIGAFGIINSIVGFIVMLLFGLSQGMQPIAGYNFGAGQMDRVKEILWLTIRCATVVATVCFLLCMLLPHEIAKMFTKDSHLIALTAHAMRLYAAMLILDGFQVVASSFFQSINKASVAIFLSLTRQLFCLVPCLLIFPLFWSSDGVWMSQPSADFLAALIAASVLAYHLHKGILSQKKR